MLTPDQLRMFSLQRDTQIKNIPQGALLVAQEGTRFDFFNRFGAYVGCVYDAAQVLPVLDHAAAYPNDFSSDELQRLEIDARRYRKDTTWRPSGVNKVIAVREVAKPWQQIDTTPDTDYGF